jgi:hypothetical protein
MPVFAINRQLTFEYYATVSGSSDTSRTPRRNADVAWDYFSADFYKERNYAQLRPDDRLILLKLRKFFASSKVRNGRGIDAGTGPNLYPMLALLPFCDEIRLLDISESNVKWLQNQMHEPDRSWDAFWATLTEHRSYREVGDYRSQLGRVTVEKGDLLEMPPSSYDIGTMFFVAESFTDHRTEFEQAVRTFVRSLKKGAPFAIAFMRGSKGYPVDNEDYPAVAVYPIDVKQCLKTVARRLSIMEIELVKPIHAGYDGMMLATGRAAYGTRDGEKADEDPASAQPPRDLAWRCRRLLQRWWLGLWRAVRIKLGQRRATVAVSHVSGDGDLLLPADRS